MKNINLLLLDDREENLVSLKALLQDIDYVNIISSTDPNAALKICWREDISIALVDVQMPQINGFEFVSLLKSNPKTSHIMAIMVTAISKEDKYLLKGFQSGAVDYLYKPLNPDVTRAKVISFVRQIRLQEEIKQKNLELELSKQELLIAKEEAEQARKSKEIFLANMSHEIRTPIHGITGIAQMLKNSHLTTEQLSWIQMLDKASQSLLVIINDILDVSKIDSGKFSIEMEDFRLDEFIENINQVFKIKAKDKGLEFVTETQGDLPRFVKFDPLRLQQIMSNFISNSFKFTEVGSVRLVISRIDKQENKHLIRFAVRDTGIGIQPDQLSKLFDPFEQGGNGVSKRFGGTGLGLSIVKKLAELLHGEIGVETEIGKGSLFYFEAYFEEANKHLSDESEIPYSQLPKFAKTRILLAEDNDLNSFMISHMLNAWNCEIDLVKNGKDALDQAIKNEYDLILMDTHMPILNGLEAIKLIRKHHDPERSTVPIITISASVLQHEQAEAINAGANEVIGKPFDAKDLYHRIKRILETKKTWP